jgi:hypothetical protein
MSCCSENHEHSFMFVKENQVSFLTLNLVNKPIEERKVCVQIQYMALVHSFQSKKEA